MGGAVGKGESCCGCWVWMRLSEIDPEEDGGSPVEAEEYIALLGCCYGRKSDRAIFRAETGRRGENIALSLLKGRGMRLLARNWRSGHSELDLVMADGEFVRIVEVRSLVDPDSINPYESIGSRKRENLLRGARSFIALNRIGSEVFFDIVSVIFDRNHQECEVEYIPSAFTPLW